MARRRRQSPAPRQASCPVSIGRDPRVELQCRQRTRSGPAPAVDDGDDVVGGEVAGAPHCSQRGLAAIAAALARAPPCVVGAALPAFAVAQRVPPSVRRPQPRQRFGIDLIASRAAARRRVAARRGRAPSRARRWRRCSCRGRASRAASRGESGWRPRWLRAAELGVVGEDEPPLHDRAVEAVGSRDHPRVGLRELDDTEMPRCAAPGQPGRSARGRRRARRAVTRGRAPRRAPFDSSTPSSPWKTSQPTCRRSFIQTTAVAARSPPTSTPTQIRSPGSLQRGADARLPGARGQPVAGALRPLVRSGSGGRRGRGRPRAAREPLRRDPGRRVRRLHNLGLGDVGVFGEAHSSKRRFRPRASVTAPRRTACGWAKARVRSLPSGLSAPWPAVEIVISFDPASLSIAVGARCRPRRRRAPGARQSSQRRRQAVQGRRARPRARAGGA